jgi:hypothetical protein
MIIHENDRAGAFNCDACQPWRMRLLLRRLDLIRTELPSA